jgi:hypothetical protein
LQRDILMCGECWAKEAEWYILWCVFGNVQRNCIFCSEFWEGQLNVIFCGDLWERAADVIVCCEVWKRAA